LKPPLPIPYPYYETYEQYKVLVCRASKSNYSMD
jgi:hypothetical protein